VIKRTVLAAVLAMGIILTLNTSADAAPLFKHTKHQVWGAIGDSITYGIGSSDPATKSYPARAGIPGHGRPGQGLVVSGWWPPLLDTFSDDLRQMVADHGVNTVVLEVGINDLSFGITDQQYFDGYTQVKALGAAQGVRVVFSTITPFGPERQGVTPEMQAQRQRVNAWIRGHRRYVDFAAGLGGDVLAPAYDSDGLHPNDAGHERLAQVLESSMQRVDFACRAFAPCR